MRGHFGQNTNDMIYDQWRDCNFFGEVNAKPSLTEPAKTYTVYDYLRDPSLVLGSRRPVEEPVSPDDIDVLDSWDQEIPRDPSLYGAGDAASAPRSPKAGTGGAKAPKPGANAPKSESKDSEEQAADAEGANKATE